MDKKEKGKNTTLSKTVSKSNLKIVETRTTTLSKYMDDR